MQVSPTFSTRILVGLAVLLLIAAVVRVHATAFAWSAALLLGLAASRLFTQSSVGRARSAGFEMLWQQPNRSLVTVRNGEVHLKAELRNRSNELLVLDSIAALAPPELFVVVEPTRALLPARSALPITVTTRPLRVGTHGLQGLTVIVRSDASAFDARLTFANPFVFEVRPCAAPYVEPPRRGGLGREFAPANRTGNASGDSLQLRELREHRPGDPLRKVAWKASARRGRLLVRDDEQEHRHLVWFVLDASVELWAGQPAEASLDHAIDRIASMIRQSLRQGDRVGLCIVGARTLARISPDQGSFHEDKLLDALTHAVSVLDYDRSGLDEEELASLVLEHLRPMDPTGTRGIGARDLDNITRLAQRALGRARLRPRPEPLGPTPRDRLLRRYVAEFGLPIPARTTTDRDLTDKELIATLKWLAEQRPDRIRVCSPWPRQRLLDGMVKIQRRLKKSRISLDWVPMRIYYGVEDPKTMPQQLVHESFKWRASVEDVDGKLALRRLGIASAPRVIRRGNGIAS
ncbi:MAG TPA: DUF58 domain-containing protein [Polyangiaceae bacterium]|nr:DUF58 domain-containing protein [Polyangiaceae bacterium]